jgi:hypothetical protein
MHLIDKDPMTPDMKTKWDEIKAKRASSTATSTPDAKKGSLGTAIKNKLRSAAGAPGRAIYNKMFKPHDDYKMDKSNDEYKFLKSYNDRSKSRVPVSNKERAQFQMFKDRK